MGMIPNFSALPNLSWVSLHDNQLTGTLPNFSALPNLRSLSLSKNQLTGTIPNFSALPNLSQLYLAWNQLTGTIPDFSALPNLKMLVIYENQLCKDINVDYSKWQDAVKQFPNCSSSNQPPIATFTVSPQQGQAPLTVNLDGSQSNDVDGNIINYAWLTSDGQQTSGGNQQITFVNAGTYTITLTVTDNDGLTGQTQQTVILTQNLVPDIRIEPTTLRFSQ
jgi:Leucine-rich repeat (LRR) protein